MANLPVPGAMYFRDFALELVQYDIERNKQIVASLQGMPNSENGNSYVHFTYGSDVQIGDVLVSGQTRSVVKLVDIDTYQGKPELIMAVIH